MSPDVDELSRRTSGFVIERPYDYVGRGRAYRVYIDGEPRQPLLVNASVEDFPVEPGLRRLAIGHGSGKLAVMDVDVKADQRVRVCLRPLVAGTVLGGRVSVRLTRSDTGESSVGDGPAPALARLVRHRGAPRTVERMLRRFRSRDI